jgi:transglutaminase-like putative cysteine protease
VSITSTAGDRSTLLARVDVLRWLSVAGVAVLLAAPLAVLLRVSNVAGDPVVFVAVVAGSMLAATLFARFLPLVPAMGFAVVVLLGGGYLYFRTLPVGMGALAEATVLEDTASLLTGLSVLRIVNAGVWAQAAAPAPAFLTWYLALRRRYVGAVVVGGATLSVFVLTGDASVPTTLAGVLGGAAAVGLGDLSAREADPRAAETVAVVLAVVVVVSLSLSVVPAAAGVGLGGSPTPGGGEGTVEASLVNAGDSIGVLGAIELSPEVRFSIRSEARSYWKVGSYDRFTGDGWVRTGGSSPYEGALSAPPGRSRSVVQTVTVESDLTVMPAAWKPRELRNTVVDARVTREGGLTPTASLGPGDRYTVESRLPTAPPTELRRAGTEYPDGLQERYTQLPANQPARVAERTARITANAQNPYDTARVLEQWLSNNREYSLDVDRPDGNIADAFLFEMDAGYCTYYATTMVSMLRTQDIPARLAVGYTPGQRVGQDRWVARGLDSHAWVEVYFPETGWVRFDPTPSGPREAAEQARVENARENDETDVDVGATRNSTFTETPAAPDLGTASGELTPNGSTPDVSQRLSSDAAENGTAPPGGDGGGDGGFSVPDLSREQVGFGLVVLVGGAAAARRSGLTDRAYRVVWLRYQPRTEPVTDVERAYERVEYLLSRRGRSRRPGETVRSYLARGDPRLDRLRELYERAHYAGDAGPAAADEAVELVDDLVSDPPT